MDVVRSVKASAVKVSFVVEEEEEEIDDVAEEEVIVLFATPVKLGNGELVVKGVAVIEAKVSTVGNEDVMEEEAAASGDEDAASADEEVVSDSEVDAVETADAVSTEDAVAGETDDMIVTASSDEYVLASGELSMPKVAVALASMLA